MLNRTKRLRSHIELRKENFNKARYKFAMELLPPADSRNSKILELGSGMAEFARILRKSGYRNIYTVELNLEKLEYSKALGFPSLCADLHEGLPLLKHSFDGIVMLEVIEHIALTEALLLECHRVLNPGGFLLLSTPNFSHYSNRLRILFGRPPFAEGYHYRFFTKAAISKIAREAGFSIDKFIASAYIPLYNRLRKSIGRKEFFFISPGYLSSLIGNTFFMLAKRTA